MIQDVYVWPLRRVQLTNPTLSEEPGRRERRRLFLDIRHIILA